MHRTHLAGVTLILIGFLTIVSCSNQKTQSSPTTSTTGVIPTSIRGSSTGSLQPSAPSSEQRPTTTAPVSTAPLAQDAVDCDPSHFDAGAWNVSDKELGDRLADTQTQLASVGTGTHNGCDRFVIRVKAPQTIDVYAAARYVAGPILRDPKGDVVSVVGGAKLSVVVGTHGDTWVDRYRNDQGILPTTSELATLPVLRDVQFVGNWEGVVSFAVGVVDQNNFRLWKYYEPSDGQWRIILDIADRK